MGEYKGRRKEKAETGRKRAIFIPSPEPTKGRYDSSCAVVHREKQRKRIREPRFLNCQSRDGFAVVSREGAVSTNVLQ
jgi:hypothetical protein